MAEDADKTEAGPETATPVIEVVNPPARPGEPFEIAVLALQTRRSFPRRLFLCRSGGRAQWRQLKQL